MIAHISENRIYIIKEIERKRRLSRKICKKVAKNKDVRQVF